MELLHSKNKKGKKEKEKEVEDAKSRGLGVVEAVRIRGIILFSIQKIRSNSVSGLLYILQPQMNKFYKNISETK